MQNYETTNTEFFNYKDMIVSEFQQRKTERHETICAEFEQLTRDGGKKMAVYELLAKKYGYTAHRIWEIVNGREK